MSRVISLQAEMNCFLHFTSKHAALKRMKTITTNWSVSGESYILTKQGRERSRARKKKNAKKKLINRQKNKIKLLRCGTQSVHFIYCIFSTLQFFSSPVWFVCALSCNRKRVSTIHWLLLLHTIQVFKQSLKLISLSSFNIKFGWTLTHFVWALNAFFALLPMSLPFHIAHSYAIISLHRNKCFDA